MGGQLVGELAGPRVLPVEHLLEARLGGGADVVAHAAEHAVRSTDGVEDARRGRRRQRPAVGLRQRRRHRRAEVLVRLPVATLYISRRHARHCSTWASTTLEYWGVAGLFFAVAYIVDPLAAAISR